MSGRRGQTEVSASCGGAFAPPIVGGCPPLTPRLEAGLDFHDGSQATLLDLIDHYNHGDGVKDPWLDKDIQPPALSEPEIDGLVAFLASLTSRNAVNSRSGNTNDSTSSH